MHIFIFIILSSFAMGQNVHKCSLEDAHRTGRPEKESSALSPTGHFKVHFDISGDAAPALDDEDGNGIPDYVDAVGIIADSTRYVLVDIMGFKPEVDDDDGVYDIYIESFGANYYGVNIHEGGGKSYIKIDNDYASGFYTTGIQVMRLTVAHEFFHAIQRAYKNTQSGYDQFFYELTSTWIEDIIVPDGDDYLYWINDFFNNPQQEWGDTDGYSLALFGHYLSTQIEDIENEKESTLIRQIWEAIEEGETPYNALNTILIDDYNTSFQAVWLDFVSRNMFNEIYTNMDNDIFYYIDQTHELCTTPSYSSNFIGYDDRVENDVVVGDLSVSIESIRSREDVPIMVNINQDNAQVLSKSVHLLDSQNTFSLMDSPSSSTSISSFSKDDRLLYLYISPSSTHTIEFTASAHVLPIDDNFMTLYPNPSTFGDNVSVILDISETQHVEFVLYNIGGKKLDQVTVGPYEQGRHEISMEPIFNKSLRSGVYIVDIMTESKIFTRKFTYIK